MTELREALRRRVEALPDSELEAAVRLLDYLAGGVHPAVRAMREAPPDDEPVTDSEREALDEYERWLADPGREPAIAHDEMERRLLRGEA